MRHLYVALSIICSASLKLNFLLKAGIVLKMNLLGSIFFVYFKYKVSTKRTQFSCVLQAVTIRTFKYDIYVINSHLVCYFIRTKN